MNLIVCLISGHTTPNVQFINQFYHKGDRILFVTTRQMLDRCQWVIKATQLPKGVVETLYVDPYSVGDVRVQLRSVDYEPYDRILVNITGGTKIMSIASYDIFSMINYNTELYFLTGQYQEYFRLQSESDDVCTLSEPLSLKQYFWAHGLEYQEGTSSGQSAEAVFRYFQWHTTRKPYEHLKIASQLMHHRSQPSVRLSDIEHIDVLIRESGFHPQHADRLTHREVDYLTGGWFEEYIYHKMRRFFNLDKQQIMTGVSLFKNGQQNEYDVVFLYQGALYLIECKTSIINHRERKLVRNTLYRSASLDDMLGMHARSFVLALNERDQIADEYFVRADNYGVRLLTVETIADDALLKEKLLSHKPNRI